MTGSDESQRVFGFPRWKAPAAALLEPLQPRLLRCELATEGRLYLGRDPGSLFRRAFGAALKHESCPLGACCQEGCQRDPACLYGVAFESRADLVGPGKTRMSHWTHPLVLRVENGGAPLLPKGTLFGLDVLLLGPVRSAVHRLLEAIVETGHRGLGRARTPFLVARAALVDEQSCELPALVKGDALLLEHLHERAPVGRPPQPGSDQASLVLRTPTRVVRKQHLSLRLPFPLLIRTILRRYVALMEAFGPGRPPWKFQEILSQAQEVGCVQSAFRLVDNKRWSRRQGRKVPEGGIVGRALYEGPVDTFAGLLQTGACIHIGKGTLMGHGRYTIRFS